MQHDLSLVKNLASYIPTSLTKRILNGAALEPGQSRVFQAATLFCDITGFTAMSDELASDGPRGAEELNRVLKLTFTDMINLIHEMGGSINHFHGDAMSVTFPDDDGLAASRALTCAHLMQKLMTSQLNSVVVNRPPGKLPYFDLTMKVGLGYGSCRETIVGDLQDKMEFIVSGPAIDAAAAAESVARAGEILASRAFFKKVGLKVAADFSLAQLPPDFPQPIPTPLLNWEAFDDHGIARLVTAVSPFLPPTIYERITTGLNEMAEHRPVTSLFVQFNFKTEEKSDYDDILQEYYQWANRVVARYGSHNARLNRVLTGDKGNQLHIVFGAPVAPDAPTQAVRCALAILNEQPSYIEWQRIGLATGKVFACPVGAEERREYTIVGSVVNLSARITQFCEKGQLLIDQMTMERVKEWIEFESKPIQRNFKGHQEELNLFQPIGERTIGERGSLAQLQVFINRWQRPLVGRQQELDLLLGGMDAALRGVAGVAAVYGSTGVGKTSLLAKGLKHWLEAEGMALASECQQHTIDIPFGPWRTIWRDFLGLSATMSIEEQVQTVINRTESLLPECGDDVNLWGDALGLPFPQTESQAALTAEVRQSRLFTLVQQVMGAAAAQQPLLIILEGLHWADRSTLAFIDAFSQHIEGHAIFLVLTFRPLAKLSLELFEQPICVPIILSDLPTKHARSFLKLLVGVSDLPPAIEQYLGLRSRDGLDSPVNPLFLEEAVNVMKGLGVLQVNGRLQVNEALLTNMQIPDTIHGLLLARIDRLPVANRDLLQVASVIGRQFTLEPLVSILQNTSRETAAMLLAELSAEEITQLMATDPEYSYLFQHAMTHEVAYASLPFARRQTLHAAVAEWLQDRNQDNLKPVFAVLAYHYSRAGNREQGLHFSLLAADNAREIFANQEAIELYTLAENHLQAINNSLQWETAVHLFLARGEVFRLVGEFPKAIADAERAIQLAGQNQAVAQSAQGYNLLAHLKYNQSHYEEVQQLAGEVIAKPLDIIPPDQRARALQWSGLAAASLSNFAIALDQLNQAEQICRSIGDNQTLADVLGGVAFTYYSQKKLEPALETMQRALSISRGFSTPIKIGFLLNNIALIQLNLGRPNEALLTLHETADMASDTSKNLLAYATVNRGEVYTYLGLFPEAKKDLEQAINLFSVMNDDFGLVEAYLLLGYEYEGALENWLEAESALTQAQQLIEKSPVSYGEQQIRLLIGMAKIKLALGKPNEADLLLNQAESLIKTESYQWWLPAAVYLHGRVCSALADSQTAVEYYHQAAASVEAGGRPEYLPMIWLELGLLTDDLEQKISFFKQCLLTAEKRCRHLDRILCYRIAGAFLASNARKETRGVGHHYLEKAAKLTWQETKKSPDDGSIWASRKR